MGQASFSSSLYRRGELAIIRFINRQTRIANFGVSLPLRRPLSANEYIAAKSHSY